MRPSCLFVAALVLAIGGRARAQGSPPPARAAAPPPAQYQPPPQSYRPPPPGYGQPVPAEAQAEGYASTAPGPPTISVDPQAGTIPPAPLQPEAHAPKFSLWAGARLSYVGFGFSFYDNPASKPETTGNFLGTGIAPQVDLGARLSYRYIPYVFWEHGFMGQGRRFAGTDASSTTDFYGIGLRFLSGDVDTVSFLTDLSIGRRVVTVANGSQSYSMSGVEFFRLGLGAEIRIATLLALTPLASISSGALSGTDGSISFGCAAGACGDGFTGPTYVNGAEIQTSRAYVVLSVGVGLHFDVFGK